MKISKWLGITLAITIPICALLTGYITGKSFPEIDPLEQRVADLEREVTGKVSLDSVMVCYEIGGQVVRNGIKPIERCAPVSKVVKAMLDEKGLRAIWKDGKTVPGRVVFEKRNSK